MLVAVLASSACSAVPLNLEVPVVERHGLPLEWIEYRYGHCAGVNSTAAFGWWDTLNAMATCFVTELRQIGTSDLDRDALAFRQAGSSAELASQLDVGCCQIVGKQLGVVSAFGGANFDDALHHVLLVVR